MHMNASGGIMPGVLAGGDGILTERVDYVTLPLTNMPHIHMMMHLARPPSTHDSGTSIASVVRMLSVVV